MIPHRKDKDKDREKDREKDKDRPFTWRGGSNSEFPLSPNTEMPPKDEQLAQSNEKLVTETFPETPGFDSFPLVLFGSIKLGVKTSLFSTSDFAALSETEEALLEIRENDFATDVLIRKLEDISRDYDQEVAVVRRIHDRNLNFYESLEKKVIVQAEKNGALNVLVEKLDLGNSMLQYQFSVAESKLKESEETLDNYSKLAQDLDSQLRKSEVVHMSFFWILHIRKSEPIFLFSSPFLPGVLTHRLSSLLQHPRGPWPALPSPVPSQARSR